MTGDPRIDWYDAASGREAMLRFGPDDGPVVIAASPLFEEANRTRAFMVAILRALAIRGIGSVLPDLPGQSESMVALETVSLPAMRAGYARAVERARAGGQHSYAVAVRSGALIDPDAAVRGRWHLAPQDGPALLRELSRMTQAPGDDRAGRPVWDAHDGPVDIAGNRIAAAFLRSLGDASSRVADRTVRLASDRAHADRKIEAAPLWRRSEPGDDPVLAQELADDIADWIARCEG